MNLYDTISQASLNDLIDDLLNNFHKEIGLSLDDPVNDYCGLSFDTSDGLDAGSEVIFNNGDELRIGFSNQRLALLGYTLRFYYYLLDKGDLDGTRGYGELQSFVVDLDSELVSVPFTDDQVYLQKEFDLIMIKDRGYRLILTSDKSIVMPGETVELSVDYTLGSVPIEGATVEVYDGETLLDTVVTDSNGEASLTLSDLSGSHSFLALVDGVYSQNVLVNSVDDTYIMELTVNGDSFKTTSSTPFTFNGNVFVDWGDDTGLVEYTNGYLQHSYATNGEYDVKVYGNITNINYQGFRGCTSLTSVVIPDSVTVLGESCFSRCSNLTSVVIPDSIITMEINCFYNCISLTRVVMGGVTSLGVNCFRSCTGLTSISLPNSVTSLGGGCFYGCTGLTSITLPNSVQSLGTACFRGCTGLTSVTLSNNLTSLSEQCFYECTGLNSIAIPSSVTLIGEHCFHFCSNLTSVTIQNGVTSLGDYCFTRCTGLTSITLPNSVQSLGNDCFSYTGLTSITLPNSVQSLGNDCFSYTGLTSITLPNSVQSLGIACFRYCDNLSFIKLQWTNINDILSYAFPWASGTPENLKLHIPLGTTQIYLNRGYPSDKLIEET